MKNRYKLGLYCTAAMAVTLFLQHPVLAHVGVGEREGFFHGFTHPLLGADHIIAMVAVGLWAAQLGKRALWMVPTAFLAGMAGGSAIGHWQPSWQGAEVGIIVSDFLLGALIIAALRLPMAVNIALAAVLAVFHGYAHGAEMPDNVLGWQYGMGFLAATALLHGLGMVIGTIAASTQRIDSKWLFRFGGGAIVLSSIVILAFR
jgi:urease accessory protein